MSTDRPLEPADREDTLFALSYALQHDGRRRYRHADEAMSRIVADHLLAFLEARNFVVMRRVPPTPGPAPYSGAPRPPGET